MSGWLEARVAELIGAAEAAARLGVKPATLYSYVSRGVLRRRRAPGSRSSLFDAEEVAALARQGRPRGRATSGELVVESAITQVSGGQLRFRGLAATGLAARCRFEDVAELLWTGTLPPAGQSRAGRWRAADSGRATATAAQAVLPPRTLALERLQVIVPALAAADPFRLQLSPPAVMAAGRGIIAGMVDCLPPAGPGGAAAGAPPGGGGPPGGEPVAIRLWRRLCHRPPEPSLIAALEAALVLLADHELAASTLAARVAASVRADPYAVVATGLGAVGGALHGGAALGAEMMLAAAAGPAEVPRVVGELLRRGERIPGFGHVIYAGPDPRAEYLLAALRAAVPGSPRLAVAEAVLAEAAGRGLPQPNVDFALAVLTSVAGLQQGAGQAVFAIARTAGWLAHALEAYQGEPLRPRAVYTG
jgi:citrate synthase